MRKIVPGSIVVIRILDPNPALAARWRVVAIVGGEALLTKHVRRPHMRGGVGLQVSIDLIERAPSKRRTV